MNLSNIFNRNETDEVPVPEIEVRGDRLRVQRSEEVSEPGLGEQEGSQEQNQTRDLRLPKTKWFLSSAGDRVTL
jgi:hypothetical protein